MGGVGDPSVVGVPLPVSLLWGTALLTLFHRAGILMACNASESRPDLICREASNF